MPSIKTLASEVNSEYDILLRIMILGDTGVGKTCMLQRFCDSEFRYSHVCTIGIDFKMKTLDIDNIKTRIQVWDTAGQERYQTITRQYYRKAQGIILSYDITNEKSFMNIRKWVDDITQFGDEKVCIILVGNKGDREDSREVTFEQGQKLADSYDLPFEETSAYTNENVTKAFETISRMVLEKHKDEIQVHLEEKTSKVVDDSEIELSGTSEDEGIVQDLELPTKPDVSGEMSKFDCCNIL